MAATITSILLVLIAQVIGAPMPILLKKWSGGFSFGKIIANLRHSFLTLVQLATILGGLVLLGLGVIGIYPIYRDEPVFGFGVMINPIPILCVLSIIAGFALLYRWSVQFDRLLMGGLFCMAVSTVLFIAGLRGGDLSVLYPLVSTIYIWVCLLSVKFLGERMNSQKWVGIACVIVGVALIGFGSS